MTIKLVLLKSGEDIISDVTEMTVGDESDYTVVGYFLRKPCIVKMHSQNILNEDNKENNKKAGFSISLVPWMPLSKDDTIPEPSDWVVTMVEPVTNLFDIYNKNVMEYGKENDKDSSTSEQYDSNQSD